MKLQSQQALQGGAALGEDTSLLRSACNMLIEVGILLRSIYIG